MTTVAYYATLDNRTEGTALRTSTGAVHFQTASTGLWQSLTNVDIPRLNLLGRMDLADTQALLDGSLSSLATSRANLEV